MNDTSQPVDRELLLRCVQLISDQLLLLQRELVQMSPDPMLLPPELQRAVDRQRVELFEYETRRPWNTRWY